MGHLGVGHHGVGHLGVGHHGVGHLGVWIPWGGTPWGRGRTRGTFFNMISDFHNFKSSLFCYNNHASFVMIPQIMPASSRLCILVKYFV